MAIDWSKFGPANTPTPSTPTTTTPVAPAAPGSLTVPNFNVAPQADGFHQPTQEEVDHADLLGRFGMGVGKLAHAISGDSMDEMGKQLFGQGNGSPLGGIPFLGGAVGTGGDVLHGIGDLSVVKPFEVAKNVISGVPLGWLPGGADDTFKQMGDWAKVNDPAAYQSWQAVEAAAAGDLFHGGNLKADFNVEFAKYLDDQKHDSVLGSSPLIALGREGIGSLGGAASNAIQGWLGLGANTSQGLLGGLGVFDPSGTFWGGQGYDQQKAIYDATGGKGGPTQGNPLIAGANLTDDAKYAFDQLKAGKFTEEQARDYIAKNVGANRDRVTEAAARMARGEDVSDVEQRAVDALQSGEWSQQHANDWIVSHGQGVTRNPVGQIAGTVLTDPLTYATIGAGAVSGLGKTGAQIGEAAVGGAFKTLPFAEKVATVGAQEANFASLKGVVAAVQADKWLGGASRIARGFIDPFAVYKPNTIARATTNLQTDVSLEAFNRTYAGGMNDVKAIAREFDKTPETQSAAAAYSINKANEMVTMNSQRTLLEQGMGEELMHLNADELAHALGPYAGRDAVTELTDHMTDLAHNTFTPEEEANLAGRMSIVYGKDVAYWEKRLPTLPYEARQAFHAITHTMVEKEHAEALAAIDHVAYTGKLNLRNNVVISAETLDDVKATDIIDSIRTMLKDENTPDRLAAATAEWNAQSMRYPHMATIGYAPGGKAQLNALVDQLEKDLQSGGITKRVLEEELTGPQLKPLRDLLDRHSIPPDSGITYEPTTGLSPQPLMDEFGWPLAKAQELVDKAESMPTKLLEPLREIDRRANPELSLHGSLDELQSTIEQQGGMNSPIIVWWDPATKAVVVADGNHRLTLALEQGWEHIPVVVEARPTADLAQAENIATIARLDPKAGVPTKGVIKPSEFFPGARITEGSASTGAKGGFISVPEGALPVGHGKIYQGDATQVGGAPVRGMDVISPDWEHLPDEVYHVTTNLEAVNSSGVLKAGGAGGLGGDARDQMVSLTVSKDVADQLTADMKLVAKAYRSTDPSSVFTRQAEIEGWDAKWLNSNLFEYGGKPSATAQKYSVNDWQNAYFNMRPGKQNPIIFGDSLKNVDPTQIGVITVPKDRLKNGALLTNFDYGKPGGLQEIRSYGDIGLGPKRDIPNAPFTTKASGTATLDEIKANMGLPKRRPDGTVPEPELPEVTGRVITHEGKTGWGFPDGMPKDAPYTVAETPKSFHNAEDLKLTTEDGTPMEIQSFTVKNASGKFGIPGTERPIQYVYRAVSEEDYQNIIRTGTMKSDGRMNLSADEGTVAALSDPSFYLPGELASDTPGQYAGRIIKIKVEPGDGWHIDGRDSYIKTNEAIPAERIEIVSPKIVKTRTHTPSPHNGPERIYPDNVQTQYTDFIRDVKPVAKSTVIPDDQPTRLWNLGFRPDESVSMGLKRSPLNGRPVVDRAPTVSHIFDAVPGRQPFSDTTRNVMGQIIGKSAAERANKPIESIEAFINTQRDMVTGQRLVHNIEHRFERSTFDLGVPKPLSKEIMAVAKDVAGMNVTTIRGIAPRNLWKEVADIIPRDLVLKDGTTLNEHVIMDHLLKAAEGDLRIMGATSVFSQRVRNAARSMGDGANWSGQMTVTQYNKLRYAQPMFLIQRVTDSIYYSIMYGIQPLLKSGLDAKNAATRIIEDNLGRTGRARYFSMDMPEYATRSNFTSGIKSSMQQSGLTGNKLQRILSAPDDLIAANMTNMMYARWGDIVKGTLDNLASIAEKGDPALKADMLAAGETLQRSFADWRRVYSDAAGRVLDDNEVGLRYAQDMLQAWRRHAVREDGTINMDALIHEGERAMPDEIADIGPIRPDDLAIRMGYQDAVALRRDVAGHIENMNGTFVHVPGEHDAAWLEEQLRTQLNAHPDYTRRALAYFNEDWESYWTRLSRGTDQGGLDISPHYAKEAQDLIAIWARDRNMDPWEYLSGVMATNIGAKDLDTHMGQLISFLKSGKTKAPLEEWTKVFRSTLDVSGQQELLREFESAVNVEDVLPVPKPALWRVESDGSAMLPKAYKDDPAYIYRIDQLDKARGGFKSGTRMTIAADAKDARQVAGEGIFRIKKDAGGVTQRIVKGNGRITKAHVAPEDIEMLGADGKWATLGPDPMDTIMSKDFPEAVRQRLLSGVPHQNPEVESYIQQFSKWVQDSIGETLSTRTRLDLRRLVAEVPTTHASPFNRSQALVVSLLKDKIQDAQRDVFRLAEMQTQRTVLERTLNHPLFGLYPASYMWGKVLPETVKFLAKNPYAATYVIADVQRAIAIQREFDDDMDSKVSAVDRSAGAFLLDYLTPSLPWSDHQSRMSPMVRDLLKGDPGAVWPDELATVSPERWVSQISRTVGELPGAANEIMGGNDQTQSPQIDALKALGAAPTGPTSNSPVEITGPTSASALGPILQDDLARLSSILIQGTSPEK